MKIDKISCLILLCVSISCTFLSCDSIKNDNANTNVSYASGYFNTTNNVHCYRTLNGKTALLDYESMESTILCNKPNCTHSSANCLVFQLGENPPLIVDSYAYYFKDDPVKIEENEEGKADLKLCTSLYRYDFSEYQETKLTVFDGISAANNCYGWLYYDNKIFFVGNHYRREYDENGILQLYGNTGGKMELYAVDLETLKTSNYGDLYNLGALSEFYPGVTNSGEVYLRGIFENKIFFDVAFMADEHYETYVKYYDLETGEFVGDPMDYSKIDFSAISFLSEEYLAISKDQEITVYTRGIDESIVITNSEFKPGTRVSVFDNNVFYFENLYDLSTKECRIVDSMAEKTVIARYNNSYIISASDRQEDFQKIPISDILE